MSEELFSELYADVLSDCPSDFEFSDSDSDDSDIRPSKRQRRILSDSEADSDEEWNDIDIVPSLEDYSRNSRVPNFECDPPSIVDVIDSFFDDEFFNLVVSQTNLYHTQMKDLHKNSAKTLQWKEVTTNDMKKFLGLLLVFQAEKGPRKENEMALDDIEIKNSACGKTAECNFNNNYCSYFLNETSDFAWLLGTGRVVNTQFVDKTPADSSVENGMYIYTDMTSPSLKENQQAVLMSEILEVPIRAVSCLTFYYHLNGEDSSTLSVGKATLDNTDRDMKYNEQEVYSTVGKSGGGWTQKSLDVAGNQGTMYQLYFKATRGKGPRAFIAVDDISVTEEQCKAPPTPTPEITTTEMPVTSVTCNFDKNDFCSWKADSGKLKWKISDTKKVKEKMPKFDH
ncbi:MAM and LDL-receptor class A domain-containing protein 1, partial [Araneus ventricosus]